MKGIKRLLSTIPSSLLSSRAGDRTSPRPTGAQTPVDATGKDHPEDSGWEKDRENSHTVERGPESGSGWPRPNESSETKGKEDTSPPERFRGKGGESLRQSKGRVVVPEIEWTQVWISHKHDVETKKKGLSFYINGHKRPLRTRNGRPVVRP